MAGRGMVEIGWWLEGNLGSREVFFVLFLFEVVVLKKDRSEYV